MAPVGGQQDSIKIKGNISPGRISQNLRRMPSAKGNCDRTDLDLRSIGCDRFTLPIGRVPKIGQQKDPILSSGTPAYDKDPAFFQRVSAATFSTRNPDPESDIQNSKPRH